MGKLLFGNEETISCITHVEVKGPKGESLCLAHKTTKVFFGAGVRLVDDGYTLGVEAGNSDKLQNYFPIDGAEMKRLQAEGLVPSPLPSYTIPWYEYAFGYSLWLVVVFAVIMSVLANVLKKRRAAACQAEVAEVPPSLGPPIVTTDVDKFIDDQIKPLLRARETVQHQAYAMKSAPSGSIIDAATQKVYFVALTTERLFRIETRQGAFGILRENRGCEIIERAQIVGASLDDRTVILEMADHTKRTLWIDATKKASNQHAFLRDVPRLLQRPASSGL